MAVLPPPPPRADMYHGPIHVAAYYTTTDSTRDIRFLDPIRSAKIVTLKNRAAGTFWQSEYSQDVTVVDAPEPEPASRDMLVHRADLPETDRATRNTYRTVWQHSARQDAKTDGAKETMFSQAEWPWRHQDEDMPDVGLKPGLAMDLDMVPDDPWWSGRTSNRAAVHERPVSPPALPPEPSTGQNTAPLDVFQYQTLSTGAADDGCAFLNEFEFETTPSTTSSPVLPSASSPSWEAAAAPVSTLSHYSRRASEAEDDVLEPAETKRGMRPRGSAPSHLCCCLPTKVEGCSLPTKVEGCCLPTKVEGCSLLTKVDGQLQLQLRPQLQPQPRVGFLGRDDEARPWPGRGGPGRGARRLATATPTVTCRSRRSCCGRP